MNQWYIVLDGGRIVKMFMGVCLPLLSYDVPGPRTCIALGTGCACFCLALGFVGWMGISLDLAPLSGRRGYDFIVLGIEYGVPVGRYCIA